MRKIHLYGLVSLLLVSMFSSVIALAADTNLITNASVEDGSGQTPTAWQSNAWGDNTSVFSYASEGRIGSRSLKIDYTAKTSGDAKWMHQAVNVSPSTSYTYKSWYKASAQTEIDLQYMSTDGQYTYQFVKVLPASSSWKEVTATFTTPADATKLSVMHIIAQTGSLQTDDFTLSPTSSLPEVPPTTPVDDENLIKNSSFELTDDSDPEGWFKNAWGTNAPKFTYESTGRTGTKSVTVGMTSFSDGDAKWYATPVDVTAGKNYIYSDYYKANVPTNVVAAYSDAQGQMTYHILKSAPAAATWTQYSETFTVPATAKKLSIYHVVDRIGTLTLDDVNLSVALPTQPTVANVPNGSLEAVATNGTQPLNWQSSKWGTNDTQFSYATDGRTGQRSVKVTMSKYTDGDAKWYFDPVTMKPGEQYRFTTWYKGTVTPHPVVMFTLTDGTQKYFGMPQPQAASSASTWQKYSDTFSVPAGAVSGSVFMYVNQVGWLQTDDYSMDTYHPNGFKRAMLTMTFDDGHEDNTTTALPLLNQYKFKTTQCYASSFIEGKSQTVINGVKAFKNSGHEICSHTVTHPFMTTVNSTQLTHELQHSKQYLEKLIGQPVRNFATPYGDYNPAVVAQIKKYYASHRSVDEGYNSKDNFNIYNVRVQNVLDTTTANDITGWIQNAQADKTWLVLVYHRVAANPGPFDTYTSVFPEHLKAIQKSGIPVMTYQSALTEVKTQL